MIPPIVRKLIPRLGSSFDPEVISVVHQIIRALKAEGYDLHDVAMMADAAPAYRGRNLAESEYAKRIRAMLKDILTGGWLDPRSAGFVESILKYRSLDELSDRQAAWLNKILRRAKMREPTSCPA